MSKASAKKKVKAIHKSHPGVGEDYYESLYIECEGTSERYIDPKASPNWGAVTCKRCLKRKRS